MKTTGVLKVNALFFLCLLLVPFCFFGQKTFETGKILDSIPVLNSKEETFSLYLPTTFHKDSLSSIIFVFEPGARGRIGATPFTEAAEAYGHIIVCSNNSKNGLMEKSFEIANRLFDHVFKSFNIKESEMYVSGFSGGSRLATAIASLTNKFKGVVACGAGFSSNPSHVPSTQNFAYVGLCGNADMNYAEMMRNKEFLNRLQFKNTLITYPDNHSWPAKAYINQAFRWLYLQENGNQKELSIAFNEELEKALVFERSGEFLLAAETYERMMTLHSSSREKPAIQKKYLELKKSKSYKRELKSLNVALTKEKEINTKLYNRLYEDFSNPRSAKLDWWEQEIGKLNKIKQKDEPQLKLMVERIKFGVFAAAYENNRSNFSDSESPKVVFAKKIRDMIYPR
ncbi:hypothetical protein [Croceitalea rosinachiae]|uniref:Phospholipase/carboxylesterase/thioesterase domain-containing protein n=1 Tax=Croceitalea rosinachiae TaxID=3075596 RepID=A0ABU3A7Z7_9FLAO|nr:hypothetical protein [Croceitalea sp. F388]MDT0606291.1 hypothetical protein [Croceitalea sp. F388]